MLLKQETWELIVALSRRDNVSEIAMEAFRQAYPDAPLQMITGATFHVATDGVAAAFEWLAAVELFLRDPTRGLDEGATIHLLYHIYNWQQFQSLLPSGRTGLLEWVTDAQQLLAEGDPQGVLNALQQLRSMLEATLDPPNLQ